MITNSVRSKYFELIQYKEFQAYGGIVDKEDPKSLYLQFRGHLFCNNQEGPQELKLFYWGIKQTINRALDNSICDKNFISELEFSESFKIKPYTYYIMDFTFFPNDIYHDNAYIYLLDDMVKKIHRDNFITSPFEFYAYKKDYKIESKNINSIRTSH
jgi:hypothetical protein